MASSAAASAAIIVRTRRLLGLTSPSRVAILVAALFGLASFVRDAILLWRFGFYTFPDTQGYLKGDAFRSRPYPVMAWLTNAIHHPENLVWLQLVMGAVATATLVWVVWRSSRKLAAAIGTLFILDIGWATNNRQLLSEGAFVSFSVLTLAVFGYQYEKRRQLRPLALVLAGCLFAWTCTIRPSNVYLLIPIAGAYLVFTRSWSKTAWLSAGMTVLLLASAWLTLVQAGRFRVGGPTGYFVSFPLFSYQVFSPANGAASVQIDNALRACDPDPGYSKISIATSNQYLWGEYFGCLHNEQGWSDDRIDQTFTAAYVEAIRAHPQEWLRSWGGWFVIGLGYPPQEVLNYTYKALIHGSYMRELWQRINPNPNGDAGLYRAMSSQGSLSWEYVLAVAIVWLAILGLIIFRTAGTVRVLALGAVVFVVYTCATVPAGHVFLPRYVEVLSPMHALLAVVLLMIAGEFLYRLRYRRT